MTQLRGEGAKTSTASSAGLTPLHRAVLKNDANAVRKIVSERELGVDVRTATGTTPLMIAALYGRLNIFLHLLGKKASTHKKDSQGNDPMAYVKQKMPFVQNLLREYGTIATMKPDRGGRRSIYVMLKAMKHQNKRSYAQGQAAARDEARTQAQGQTPAQLDQSEQQKSLQDTPKRFVFLRSPGGKQQEFAEIKQVTVAKHGDLLRHCTGFICGVDESCEPTFAISGWGSKDDKAPRENVLGDMEYTELVRTVAGLLEFELTGNNWLDQRFPGTPAEQKGAYFACHSEKKLAVYVLIKALSHALNTQVLTINNIMLLKERLSKLPPGLRETTIHLDHGFVCSSCYKFLDVLTQKTGLVFRIESHDWYTPGKRSQLYRSPDGQYQPVTQAARQSSSQKNAEVIDDELGLFDEKGDVATDLQCDSAGQEGDTVLVPTNPATPRRPESHQSCATRQVVRRVPSDPEKRGSPVEQEPPYNSYPYPKFDVTPPSHSIQALPTPQSHARANEMPRITTSPSPAPRSSALGSENHSSSMSPSLSQEWEVEDIVATEERNGVRWYLVKWRGFPDENDSWERESNLVNAQEAISKFKEELQAVVYKSPDTAL